MARLRHDSLKFLTMFSALFYIVTFLYFCYAAESVPIITWVSEPAFPGEAILVLGGVFDESCNGNISTTSNDAVHNLQLAPIVNQTKVNSIKFVIPANFVVDVYTVTVTCGSLTSKPYYINAPRPYWIQGDQGQTATSGGWIRVQGLNVAFLTPEAVSLRSQHRSVYRTLRHQLSTFATSNVNTLLHAAKIEDQLAHFHSVAPTTTIRLTKDAASVDLPAVMLNATQWSVHVPVPLSLQPGTYSVSISNGMGSRDGLFIPLDSFVSASHPHVSTITIVSQTEAAWAPDLVFVVNKPSLPVPWPWNDTQTSDAAVQVALDQVKKIIYLILKFFFQFFFYFNTVCIRF